MAIEEGAEQQLERPPITGGHLGMPGTELVITDEGPLLRHTEGETGTVTAESPISITGWGAGIVSAVAQSYGIPRVDERTANS